MPKIINYGLADISPSRPGKYLAELKDVHEGISKRSGYPVLVWEWSLIECDIIENSICSFPSLQKHAPFFLNEHLKAFGLTGAGKVDLNSFIGRKACLVIEIGAVIDNFGNEQEEQPYVTSVLPEEEYYINGD